MKPVVIWTAVMIGIVGVGLSTAYAITTHEPTNFLRAFGCSLPK